MPWGLLRLASIVLAIIGLRRGKKGQIDAASLRRRASKAKRGASLLARTLGAMVTGGFAAITATAGLTLLSTGPRWLAILFLGAAIVATISTAIEVWSLRREVRSASRRP